MELITALQILTLVVAVIGASGSIYNAFFIQRPWRKDYLEDRKNDNK